MNSLERHGGTWVGFWTQGPIKGHMRFDLFFEAGRIHGGGCDRDGAFTMGGQYDSEGVVSIFKRYPNLMVMYTGQWNGSLISGASLISDGIYLDEGAFEIWPEGEEMSINLEEVFEVATGRA